MDADSAQRAREGNLFPNHCQGSTGPPPADEPNITGNIHPGRAGLMAGISELYCLYTPDLFAHPDAAFTENAEIAVANKEGAIIANGQPFGLINGREFVYANVVDCPLQITILVLGTNYAPVFNRHLPETNIEWAAALTSVTGQTGIGMTAQDDGEGLSPQFLYPWGVGLN